jgi:hypothetical protein
MSSSSCTTYPPEIFFLTARSSDRLSEVLRKVRMSPSFSSSKPVCERVES